MNSKQNRTKPLQIMTEEYLEHNSSENVSYFYDYYDTNSSDYRDDPIELYFSFHVLVMLTLIDVSLFILGIIGNVLTCIVIASDKSMHTATNFYLISLSISDMLILFTNVPFCIYHFWSTDFNIDIYLLYVFFSEIASNSSILTVTVLTVERYLAICHPFNEHSMSNLDVVKRYIIVIWVVSCFLSAVLGFLPVFFERFMEVSISISAVLLFFIPIVIMSVLYSAIGCKLKKRNKDLSTQKTSSDDAKIIKMLSAILIVFILCWAPFHVDRVLETFHLIGYEDSMIAFAVAATLYPLSTTLNPVLYSLMSNKFRKGFKDYISHMTKKSNLIPTPVSLEFC